MGWTASATPRRLARIAGALYLVNIVLGFFAIGYVPTALQVAGDPAATMRNLAAFTPDQLQALAYLVSAFASLLAPAVGASLFPLIALPSLVGEGSLCLWCLTVGLNVRRWQERAAAGRPAAAGIGAA